MSSKTTTTTIRETAVEQHYRRKAKFGAIESTFDMAFEMIGNILLSFIRRLAPFTTPMAPAFFFGFAVAVGVQHIASQQTPAYANRLALLVGSIAALGLESAGIMASHYAIRLYNEQDGRWQIAGTTAILYLIIGISTIWLLEDSVTTDIKLVGTAMFLISFIVYILVGLADSVSRAEEHTRRTQQTQRTNEQQQRQWQHEQHLLEQQRLAEERRHERELAHQEELEKARLAHEQKMERIRAKQSSTQPAPASPIASTNGRQSQHQPAQSQQIPCPNGNCQRAFGSTQALNAHQAHCKHRIHTNGRVKEKI